MIDFGSKHQAVTLFTTGLTNPSREDTMPPTFRPHEVPIKALAGACLLGLLHGCGSGGGGEVTLSGTIRGLAPESPVILAVNGQEHAFSTPVFTAEIGLAFSGTFTEGQSYAIQVVKHPAGQICAVLRAASGRLDASVSNVLVECHTTRLNDTGIGGGTTTQIAALAPDSTQGRDAETARLTKVGSGDLGFDFTRICSSGEVVDAQGGCPTGQSWTCVRDNVTDLMWQRSDIAYTGAKPVASESQCGRINWRAPTVHELLSIVHAGKIQAPPVDANFFNATAAPALTAETYADGEGHPWAVDFSNAGAAGRYTVGTQELRRARWVSGTSRLDDPDSQSYIRTEVPPNYVIIDTSRELMWLVPKALEQGTWAQALEAVSTVNTNAPGGHADWRLPNRSELDSLANRTLKQPAMDPVVAGAIADPLDASVVYWSSSTQPSSPTSAWVVDFTYGDMSPKLKTQQARLIYVRNRAFNAQP
jgi:hypothetical protein